MCREDSKRELLDIQPESFYRFKNAGPVQEGDL